MKKNIFIIAITIAISSHLNAMELQATPCLFKNMPPEIINLIVSFLTFDDVESEEEFIERKKGLSSCPHTFYSKTKKVYIEEEDEEESLCPEEPTHEKFLKDRIMPFAWLQKHKGFTDINCMLLVVYSTNKNICAMTYSSANQIAALCSQHAHTLSIVNTTTNQEVHNICLYKKTKHREKYFRNLAISSSGNIYATIYVKKIDKNIGFKSFIKIKNLQTQQKEYPAYPTIPGNCETIAFNKQGTHLIMHKIKYDPHIGKDVLFHAIFPLTTTLDNNHTVPEKTLSHYFKQKMICKKL